MMVSYDTKSLLVKRPMEGANCYLVSNVPVSNTGSQVSCALCVKAIRCSWVMARE